MGGRPVKHNHNTREFGPSPTYRCWSNMLQRCTNPKNQDFANYGARGISVCEAWRDFANFLADMGERPTGTTIDRIDNDAGYEPGNCRWADAKTQSRNRRACHNRKLSVEIARLIRASDESGPVTAARFGVTRATVNKIRRGELWA